VAALESMAAQLAAERATPSDLAELHALMDDFRSGSGGERIVEYSDANIAFHQAIIRMSGCSLIAEMTENLFIHMRAIRKITIHQDNRAARSIIDHMRIIEALERRDPELAEKLAREHTLGLAKHVEKHGDFLDAEPPPTTPPHGGEGCGRAGSTKTAQSTAWKFVVSRE
jgi:DNA-binding GntR family transcriptional regulator